VDNQRLILATEIKKGDESHEIDRKLPQPGSGN
jgi:hypothetical protein